MDNSGDNCRQSCWDRNPEWLERLRQLVGDGAKFSGTQIAQQISAEMGRKFTRNAIIGKLHREGMTLPHTAPPVSRSKHKRRARGRSQVRVTLVPLPEPLPAPETDPEPPQGVSLVDLDSHHCRYIVRDAKPGIHELLFCGKPKVHPSVSYCETHYRVTRGKKGES